MQLTELATAILEWANKRNLIDGSTPQKQVKKLMSEFGELSDNLAKGKDIKDDIGDIFVVTTIICGQLKTKLDLSGYTGLEGIATPFGIDILYRHTLNALAPFVTEASQGHNNLFTTGSVLFCLEQLAQSQGTTLEKCVEIAYNDIKDRRGVMFDGVFVKSTDVRYGEIKYPHILKAAKEILIFTGRVDSKIQAEQHMFELVDWLNDLDEEGLGTAELSLVRLSNKLGHHYMQVIYNSSDAESLIHEHLEQNDAKIVISLLDQLQDCVYIKEEDK